MEGEEVVRPLLLMIDEGEGEEVGKCSPHLYPLLTFNSDGGIWKENRRKLKSVHFISTLY